MSRLPVIRCCRSVLGGWVSDLVGARHGLASGSTETPPADRLGRHLVLALSPPQRQAERCCHRIRCRGGLYQSRQQQDRAIVAELGPDGNWSMIPEVEAWLVEVEQ
jgi:hypothetical protein